MWNDVYLESKTLSADPVELVQMLYRAAQDRVCDARACLEKGDIKGRSAAISKAMEILAELSVSLNHDAAKEISRNLARLYAYMQNRLLEANMKQADEPLAETQKLLTTLLDGWQGVLAQNASRAASSREYDREPEAESRNSLLSNAGSPWAARFSQEPDSSSYNHAWSL
jgi:flagellar secretion chaperone FliS